MTDKKAIFCKTFLVVGAISCFLLNTCTKSKDVSNQGNAEIPNYLKSDDPLIGKSLGNYKIVKRIGEDAVSVQYQAKHFLSGDVELRILKSQFNSNAKVVEEFFGKIKTEKNYYEYGRMDGMYFGSLGLSNSKQ